MKILAIETSCEHASVALLADECVRQRTLEGQGAHSERLLGEIRALLAEGGMKLRGLDAIAFGSGPGAFTGLRLACAVAQGLALGSGLGVAPVCSLAALAEQGEGEWLLAATDARMGEVYGAAYRRTENGLVEVAAPHCVPPEALELPVAGGPWRVLGSALRAYPALIERFAPKLAGWDADAVPRAVQVALLARHQVRAGRLLPAELAAPLYVRDKVALTTAERLARGGRA